MYHSSPTLSYTVAYVREMYLFLFLLCQFCLELIMSLKLTFEQTTINKDRSEPLDFLSVSQANGNAEFVILDAIHYTSY